MNPSGSSGWAWIGRRPGIAVAMNSVRPSLPPSAHAIAQRPSSWISCVTAPPGSTLMNERSASPATQTAPSASRQMPSGVWRPVAAQRAGSVRPPSGPIDHADELAAARRGLDQRPAVRRDHHSVGPEHARRGDPASPAGATVTSASWPTPSPGSTTFAIAPTKARPESSTTMSLR